MCRQSIADTSASTDRVDYCLRLKHILEGIFRFHSIPSLTITPTRNQWRNFLETNPFVSMSHFSCWMIFHRALGKWRFSFYLDELFFCLSLGMRWRRPLCTRNGNSASSWRRQEGIDCAIWKWWQKLEIYLRAISAAFPFHPSKPLKILARTLETASS